MPQPVYSGSKITARLSRFWTARLNESQQSQARRVIRRLRRTRDHEGYASGMVVLQGRTTKVEVAKGSVKLDDGEWKRANKYESTVGETICGAVAKGLLIPQGSNDGGSEDRRGKGNSSSDSEDGFSGEGSGSEGSGDGDSGDGSEGESNGENGGDGSEGGDGGDGQNSEDGSEGDGGGEGDSDEESEGEGDSESDSEQESEEERKEREQRKRDEEENSLEFLKRRLHEIHAWLTSGEAEISDSVSNVAFKMGARMLAAGIPVRGILHALTINWTETSREQAGIKGYDPREFGKAEGRHELFPYCLALVKANVPVYLCGPTQAGKSYVLEEVADFLGIPFGITPMTQGASASWLLGTWTPEGLVKAVFPELYRSEGRGGIHVFDEMDAADPNLLIVLNNSISNDSLMNPRTGETLVKHGTFRAAGTGNTWMTGATSDYTGRQRGDRATGERFRMGRIAFDYDLPLQDSIADAEYAKAQGELGEENGSSGADSIPDTTIQDLEQKLQKIREEVKRHAHQEHEESPKPYLR